ncbi:hypothetical protein D4R87_03240 [bacterium]|nr:MAG: hypothetical protein D4R87_03240 [bacterium]
MSMFIGEERKTSLKILIDSTSLKSDNAKRLLNYSNNDLFEFVSLGKSTKHTEARFSLDSMKEINEIIIDKSRVGFFYKISDIQMFSKLLDIEYDDLILTYILATLIETSKKKIILVTERKKIFNRSNWGKNGFPNLPVNSIFSPDEAIIYIDLYCKNQNQFLIAPDYYVNKGCWYLYSLKTKLLNYQQVWSVVISSEKYVPWQKELIEITESLSNRMIDILIAIDEIGINYYKEVNNDTQDTMIYHFNYWVTLFTGIFDTLAWISKYRYQIEFERVERIGLRKNRQKDFMKLIFEKNNKIKTFLEGNSSIINLMYIPRDLIMHRTRLKGVQLDNRNEKFCFNMVQIPEGFFKRIVALSKEKGDALREWGHCKSHDDYFLEPYRFVQKATSSLIKFVDGYLELLNFDEYKKEQDKIIFGLKEKIENSDKPNSEKQFLQDLDNFNKFHLGY